MTGAFRRASKLKNSFTIAKQIVHIDDSGSLYHIAYDHYEFGESRQHSGTVKGENGFKSDLPLIVRVIKESLNSLGQVSSARIVHRSINVVLI